MRKTKKKDNKLNILKKRKILELMKNEGITRANPEALIILDKKIYEDTKSFIKKLKEHMQINARKTLKKQDILTVKSNQNT